MVAMQIPPASVLESWPAPNYEHPETRGAALIVTMSIFSVLIILSVAGRFYSRLVVKRWFGWDDGTMILALVSWVPLISTCMAELTHYPAICTLLLSHIERSPSNKLQAVAMNVVVILANRRFGW